MKELLRIFEGLSDDTKLIAIMMFLLLGLPAVLGAVVLIVAMLTGNLNPHH